MKINNDGQLEKTIYVLLIVFTESEDALTCNGAASKVNICRGKKDQTSTFSSSSFPYLHFILTSYFVANENK